MTRAAPISARHTAGRARHTGAAAALAALLLAGCASAPVERYAPPAAGEAGAELRLNLMQPSRNRSAALYVRGTPFCATGAAALINRTLEGPPRLVAGSWENRSGEVVRLPAGVPLPLRFRYLGPGEERIADVVVQLQPGARYVFDHEIPGYAFSIKEQASGLPAPQLPPKLLHAGLDCPR